MPEHPPCADLRRISAASAPCPSRHKCQALQQMHILFIFQQRAVQGRDSLGGVAVFENLVGNVVGHQQLEPVDKLGGGGLFLQAGNLAHVEKHIQGLVDQGLFDIGKVDVDNVLHGLPVGELDKVEKTAAEESVRQLLLIVAGDDYHRAILG